MLDIIDSSGLNIPIIVPIRTNCLSILPCTELPYIESYCPTIIHVINDPAQSSLTNQFYYFHVFRDITVCVCNKLQPSFQYLTLWLFGS